MKLKPILTYIILTCSVYNIIGQSEICIQESYSIQDLEGQSIVDYYHGDDVHIYCLSKKDTQSYLSKIDTQGVLIWQESISSSIYTNLLVDKVRDNIVIRSEEGFVRRYDYSGNFISEYVYTTEQHKLVASNDNYEYYIQDIQDIDVDQYYEVYSLDQYYVINRRDSSGSIQILDTIQMPSFSIPAGTSETDPFLRIKKGKYRVDEGFDILVDYGTWNWDAYSVVEKSAVYRINWNGGIIKSHHVESYDDPIGMPTSRSVNLTLSGNTVVKEFNGNEDLYTLNVIGCRTISTIGLDFLESGFQQVVELGPRVQLIGPLSVQSCGQNICQIENPNLYDLYNYSLDHHGVAYTMSGSYIHFLKFDLNLLNDNDEDGFLGYLDCNDTNSDINPDAEEIPNNGIDEDCDGEDLIFNLINFTENEYQVSEIEGRISVKYYHDQNQDIYIASKMDSLNHLYVTKIDTSGTTIWQRSYENILWNGYNFKDEYEIVINRSDEEIIIQSKLDIYRIDFDGNFIGEININRDGKLVAASNGTYFFVNVWLSDIDYSYQYTYFNSEVFSFTDGQYQTLKSFKNTICTTIGGAYINANLENSNDDFFDVAIVETDFCVGNNDNHFIFIRFDLDGQELNTHSEDIVNADILNSDIKKGISGNFIKYRQFQFGNDQYSIEYTQCLEETNDFTIYSPYLIELDNDYVLLGDRMYNCEYDWVYTLQENINEHFPKYENSMNNEGLGYGINESTLFVIYYDDDQDDDGFPLALDCDDTDANINPTATEIPNNGIDEDCDGSDLTTSINEELADQIKIYPNPVSNNLFIESEINTVIRIYNIYGIEIYSNDLRIGKQTIDVSSYISGVYFLEIQKEGKLKIERIIVNQN